MNMKFICSENSITHVAPMDSLNRNHKHKLKEKNQTLLLARPTSGHLTHFHEKSMLSFPCYIHKCLFILSALITLLSFLASVFSSKLSLNKSNAACKRRTNAFLLGRTRFHLSSSPIVRTFNPLVSMLEVSRLSLALLYQ